ncbi:carbon monoxide dehydrogenase subunit G [Albimonas sp. CAU 1670]|uniref:SRPBCC family protein n=1 Tax=Albimonas sp. CAU 1670 TaxID=3032599 RepID=UPI0023DBB3C2|nr:carbon monoxide dehydrogenase subunit G [Albimonas sp. CAU 1670]MDF2235624.1 carbon monoxide dehydrogenase subunit G [Albimonas sp. CAU 1670]
MELTGERIIRADRATVWAALNDPEVLKACIPGCERLEKLSDTEMEADVTQKVGPVKAKFKGQVTLEDVRPAEGYFLSGEGKGGAAGFAKGGARVNLSDHAEGTLLSYVAEARVGGKLAQLGSRLIDGFARKMADEFFALFQAQVEGAAPAPAAAAVQAPAPAAPARAPEMAGATSAPAPAQAAAETGEKKGWLRRLLS